MHQVTVTWPMLGLLQPSIDSQQDIKLDESANTESDHPQRVLFVSLAEALSVEIPSRRPSSLGWRLMCILSLLQAIAQHSPRSSPAKQDSATPTLRGSATPARGVVTTPARGGVSSPASGALGQQTCSHRGKLSWQPLRLVCMLSDWGRDANVRGGLDV
eukprot:6460909-Amphidinium_carterae.1